MCLVTADILRILCMYHRPCSICVLSDHFLFLRRNKNLFFSHSVEQTDRLSIFFYFFFYREGILMLTIMFLPVLQCGVLL